MKTILAKTILTKNKYPHYWFGNDYNINLYRGCHHGCIYCDSRSECYQNDDFDTVKVKKDALKKKDTNMYTEIAGYEAKAALGEAVKYN